MNLLRRRLLLAGAALAGGPAFATSEGMQAVVTAFAGGLPKLGRVTLEVAQLVDNGNAVPVTVRVDSPMSATDHVTAIAIFNERNPQPEVVEFTLGPRAGKAVIATRIRLATSQKLVAVARMSDGSAWIGSADVIVTLAACVEGAG